MEQRDWEMILTLSEELSMTKAAEKLYTSQPALTYRLNKLEEELGVTILNRHSGGITFTLEGKYIIEYSREMLESYEHLKRKLLNSFNKHETINIGVSTTFAKFRLAEFLDSFRKAYPHIKIEIKTGTSSSDLPKLLKESKVDLIILRKDIDWNGGKYLLEKEVYGIVSSEPFSQKMLESNTWIQYETKEIIQSNLYLKEWWKDHYNSSLPQDIMKINSIEGSLDMVKLGLGWMVIPEIHVKHFPALHFYPLTKKSGEPFLRYTTLLLKNSTLQNPSVEIFVNFIRQYFRN